MARAIQSRRGTTAQHAGFTGLAGEVTVDTDKKVAVVHDGSTAGGIPQAKGTDVGTHGADIASAGTLNLDAATGDLVDVTGTTTITAITLADGKAKTVRFTGALILTNGASLVLPGSQNITTAAGDFAIFRGYAAGVVRLAAYMRADGRPLFVALSTIASAATTELGSVRDWTLDISGTTTISSFGSTAPTGAVKFLRFSGALTLTYNATSMILPGAADMAVSAGDCAELRHEGSGNWRLITFQRASVVPQTEIHGIALSDETTAITTGTNKATFSLPYAFTVKSVYATLNTVSSSGIPTVDINEAGTTILSTKLTIDASEKTSATAAAAAVISDALIAANAEIGFDIDVAGTGAKGLKVFIQGYRT